ncbi:MAG: SulP family inorganic anion transporter [Actinomycetia bacterium]|nr:SulP family inorganic anion transporter [Actinomycetes bacterium]
MALKPVEQKSALERFVPIVDWLPKYRWGKWLRFDVIAALTVWALLVPEAMAYAGIAGVPPEIGLVTAPLALVGYAIFGSSKQLFVGPSSTVAIISASIVAPLAGGDGDLYLILTVWLAVFTGVLFIGLGLARLGWIAHFMASSVLSGFMVGLAVVIAVGQLDKILGIESEGGNVFEEFASMLSQFSDWDWPTIAVGVVGLALLFILEDKMPRLPGALIVMLLAIGASVAFSFDEMGIHVVGDIPAQLPNLSIPEWPGWDIMSDIVVGALAVVIVAFAESFAAAKNYASEFGYKVDADQEMIALGAANLGAGLSGGFVVDGSLSKTAAGVGAGQKTQMASLFAAALTLLTIVALTWLFEPLPEAVLGAIVVHAVWKLIGFQVFRKLWSIRIIDFWLAAVAFIGVILLGILPGIIIGIVLSLLALIYRASFPEGAELGRIKDDDGTYEYVSIDGSPDAHTLPGVVVYRQTGSLIFANADAFSDSALELLRKRTDPPATLLVIDCEQMADMDVTGAEAMLSLTKELQSADVTVVLARLHGEARVTATNAGVIDRIGSGNVYPTINSVIDALREGKIGPEASGETSE